MNIQQLKVFREIMKGGSVSSAADQLHRSQPAISACLKALEASLNITLFKREGRRLVPTPEAYYLLTEAVEILDRCQTTQQNLSLMRDNIAGSIRIASMPGPSAFLLPNFVSKYVADKPDVKVTISTRSSPQIRSLIASQSYDIGMCDMDSFDSGNHLFNSIDLPSDCVCALQVQHPLVSHDAITPSMLDGLPMGSLHADMDVVRHIQATFDDQGAEFNVRFTAQYFLPLMEFVAAGQACAIVDKLSARSYAVMHANSDQRPVVFRAFTPATAYGCSILTPPHRPISMIAQDFLNQWHKYLQATFNSDV